MVQLTEAIIKSKTRLDKLSEVRNLNLWGQDITDVSILARTPSIQVLSLSVNGISSLSNFMYCRELRELYLRKNNVANLSDIRFLMPLPHLKVLWLSDNPCAELPNYRQVVVAHLPGLEKLDNVQVTEADRRAAQGVPLLQPATTAELAELTAAYDAVGIGEVELAAGGIAGAGSGLQLQQQAEVGASGPGLLQLPRVQVVAAVGARVRGEAVGSGARSAAVGQPAPSSDSYGCGATIGTTVPGRPSGFAAATQAGPASSSITGYDTCMPAPELYPAYQQQQQHNPKRYSSSPGTQEVPSHQPKVLPIAVDYVQPQHAALNGQQQQQQQQSSTPVRTAISSRSPPAGGSSNVLYAVMALLADLDGSQLGIVQKEVEQLLAGLRTA